MIINYDIPGAIASVIKKSFGYENGALAIFSIPLSASVNLITNGVLKDRITVSGILVDIFTEEIVKSLALVLMMFVALTILYIATSIFDFYTGLSASKKEWELIPAGKPRGYIKSDKLWSSVWKFLAVMIIGSILTVFSMLFVFLEKAWLYDGFLLLMVFFYFTVISFDIHSIGENQERRFGKKPQFFGALDETFKMIGNLIKGRIKMVLGGSGKKEEPEDQYDEKNGNSKYED